MSQRATDWANVFQFRRKCDTSAYYSQRDTWSELVALLTARHHTSPNSAGILAEHPDGHAVGGCCYFRVDLTRAHIHYLQRLTSLRNAARQMSGPFRESVHPGFLLCVVFHVADAVCSHFVVGCEDSGLRLRVNMEI